ncbi:MAG: trypsin-like peptidase domain-containing protein [Planctomycetota bacterium]
MIQRPHRSIPRRLLAGVLSTAIALVLLPSPTLLAEPGPPPTPPSAQNPLKRLLVEAFSPVMSQSLGQVVAVQVDGHHAAFGTVVSADGHILTKASELVGDLDCVLSDGRVLPAEVLAIDHPTDLALLKVQAKGLTPVAWAKPAQDPAEPARPDATVTVGQWVLTPSRIGVARAVGIVSVPPRAIAKRRLVLGVQIDPTGPTKAGLLVRHVNPAMGAARAGLLPGDLITHVAGQTVRSVEEIADTLALSQAGDRVPVLLSRNGNPVELQIELSRLEPTPASRTARMNRMGTQISHRRDGFPRVIQHDSVLQPWDCGGPLLNSRGQAIGINIARAGRVASYALPADLVRETYEAMLAEPGPTVQLDTARRPVTGTPADH